jgi:hypothetical protein
LGDLPGEVGMAQVFEVSLGCQDLALTTSYPRSMIKTNQINEEVSFFNPKKHSSEGQDMALGRG